jgi:hypothetical protein
MTTSVPEISDEYRATLVRLATDEFNALVTTGDDPEFVASLVIDVGSYVDAALRVAVMLDVARPDWFRELDLDQLNMDDVDDCVLGQLYGSEAAKSTHYLDGFSLGYAELIGPHFSDYHLRLGVCSVAPRSVWVAEVARRRELDREGVLP